MHNVRESIVVELPDEYIFRGARRRVGSFDVVAIDINHPNFGYFTEYMAFWRSPHLTRWQAIPVHRGSRGLRTPEKLVAQFPEFAALFTVDEE